jgi:hypothetical protein
VGGGLDIKLRGGSSSRLAVIELSSEFVLLIACVGALLGWLDALLLMMTHSGWGLRTEFVCASRESLTQSAVDVCG